MSSSPEVSGGRPRAVVFGCAGPILGDAERAFFASADPFGFILFKRNIVAPEQVRALVAALRAAVRRPDAPILIDQEGGRVARLGPPHWPSLPPARRIGRLAERDLAAGIAAARALGRSIGHMLADVGIDVACAPVADLLLPDTHAVIGDRAFSSDPEIVGALVSAEAEGLRDAGVMPILKHIPGHGRATADSHLALPRIAAPRGQLAATDFTAFRAAAAIPWAMVAHCVYDAYDPERAASVSEITIAEAIRRDIGYRGVLIADDIGMKALAGTQAENAAATLAAGCDLTLHCSGDLREMQDVAAVTPSLTDAALARLDLARSWLAGGRSAFDPGAEAARLAALDDA